MSDPVETLTNQLANFTVNADNVSQLMNDSASWAQDLESDDHSLVLAAVTKFRKVLSVERNPPITDVINLGVLPRFVHLLSWHDAPKIQFESTWVLTNIASGSSEQTMTVVHSGAVPLFVQLLESQENDVREQAAWALGNIAGDGPNPRDFVLSHGVMSPLLQILEEPNQKVSILRNCTWTLSNLCRGKPQPAFHLVSSALPTLGNLLQNEDAEVLTDATWAISYLSDGPNERIQVVLDSGIAPRIVELMSHHNASIATPALRTVGNIVTGDDQQTQAMVDLGILNHFAVLLASTKKAIRKETCWAISNITAGSQSQIQAVLDNNLISPLIDILKGTTVSSEWEVRKEACWAVSNGVVGGSKQQVHTIVDLGGMLGFIAVLNSQDPKILSVAMEALEKIFGFADVNDPSRDYCATFEAEGGLDLIEGLQSHANNEVYEKAVKILDQYWETEEDGVAPANPDPSSTFSFGGVAGSQGFNF